MNNSLLTFCAVLVAMLCEAPTVEAGCIVAANLTLCSHLNGRKISTRTKFTKFDFHAEVMLGAA